MANMASRSTLECRACGSRVTVRPPSQRNVVRRQAKRGPVAEPERVPMLCSAVRACFLNIPYSTHKRFQGNGSRSEEHPRSWRLRISMCAMLR